MKIAIKFPTTTPVFDSTTDYYSNQIKYFTEKYKGKLLFWLLFEYDNYFTIPIIHDIYKSCLPFIYIHRTVDNQVYFEHDNGVEDIIKYPYIIRTIGCDDSDKGWRFETKDQIEEWLNKLINDCTSTNNQDIFRDGYEFFDYYDEHQVWCN